MLLSGAEPADRDGTPSRRRARGGRDFESLRDYQAGDEQRDVCWTATARRGKLVTRVYVPERSQAVWILVDGGRLHARARRRSQHARSRGHGRAGTGVRSRSASGDRVGLLTYGRRVHRRVAPGRGSTHLRELVDVLAVIQADSVEADHAAAAAAIMSAQRRRALVVWLTDVAETAANTRRHRKASAMTSPPCGAVRRHASSSHPRRRQRCTGNSGGDVSADGRSGGDGAARALLSSLGRHGALIMEVSPAELAAGLVDRYLEIKDRGVL